MSQLTAAQIWQKIQDGTFIIAEVGKGFIQTEEPRTVEEYLENAKQLVDAAAEAGADAVKLQTHTVEDEQLDINVVSEHFKGSDRYSWVKRNTEATPVEAFWKPLWNYCAQKEITVFSTPMSRGAAQLLDALGVEVWKVGSGDILDFVMLDYLRCSGKPIIISSGMSTLEEVEKALNFIREKNDKVALLHCVSKYPCPPEELNLRTIEFYKERFDLPVGFSDHAIENEASYAAVAMGATVLEKHFSFSRELWGSDHKVSQTPEEFTELVKNIRHVESDDAYRAEVLASELAQAGMGEKGKILQDGETKFRPLFRKALMAGRDLEAGTILKAEDVYAMRPQAFAGGVASEEYESIIGRKLKTGVEKYEPITKDIMI